MSNKTAWGVTFLTLLVFSVFSATSLAEDDQKFSGRYLGQTPPGETPVLFAPNVVSTGLKELNAVFFNDGKELIFSVSFGTMRWALVHMKEVDGVWTDPEVLPFSGLYSDVDACVSPDNSRVWFASNRPVDDESEPKEDFDLWYVDIINGKWSEAKHGGSVVNSDQHEFFPCVTTNNNLYFQSRREGGPGFADIWVSELKDGVYQEPEVLPAPINSEFFEGDTFISADESYAIVAKSNENRGWSDLWISFKRDDNSWGKLINLGPELNSPVSEITPHVTQDGKYLFFCSRRREDVELGKRYLGYADLVSIQGQSQNGNGNIFWVDASVLERFKEKSLSEKSTKEKNVTHIIQ